MRNIIMITFDSLRADHCGYMGYSRDTTPTIDLMAREGVSFEKASSVAPRTNMSMSSVMTGVPQFARTQISLHPERSREHLRRHGTIASELSDEGYATAGYSPNAHTSSYYGFDFGFDHFQDFLFQSDTYKNLFDRHTSGNELYTHLRNFRNLVRREEVFKTWDKYIDKLIDWVDDQAEPFFVWAFSLDTHFPHLVPRTYRRWSNLLEMYYYNWVRNNTINEFDIDISERTLQKLIDIYDDSIHFADRFIEQLSERLEEYDPIFVLHSDHGEAFDERGIVGHFYPQLYEELVHVPLIVYNADSPAANVEKPVSLAQLPDIIRRVNDDSESVADVGRDWVVSTDYDGRRDRKLVSIRMENWKYHRTITEDWTRDELYDLSADPGETNNILNEGRDVGDLLENLVECRLNHESEQQSIRNAVISI